MIIQVSFFSVMPPTNGPIVPITLEHSNGTVGCQFGRPAAAIYTCFSHSLTHGL